MKVQGVSHIAIGVTDMDASLRFYRDVLGLEAFVDQSEDVDLPNVSPHRRRAAYVAWPGGEEGRSFLVLDSRTPSGGGSPRREMTGLGVHHFALAVDNVDGFHERAVAAGTEIMIAPTTFAADHPMNPFDAAVRSVYLRDPDGNVVELDQFRV